LKRFFSQLLFTAADRLLRLLSAEFYNGGMCVYQKQ